MTNLSALNYSTVNAIVSTQRNLSAVGFTSLVFGAVGDTTINGNSTTSFIGGGVGEEETLTVTKDLTNFGLIELGSGDAARLTVGGTLFYQPGKRILSDSSQLDVGTGGGNLNGALVNLGTVTIDQGETNLTGSATNTRPINLRGAHLTVHPSDPARTFANTGAINASSSRSLVALELDGADLIGRHGRGDVLIVTDNQTQTGGAPTQLNNGSLTAECLADLQTAILAGIAVINANVPNIAEINALQPTLKPTPDAGGGWIDEEADQDGEDGGGRARFRRRRQSAARPRQTSRIHSRRMEKEESAQL